MEWVENTGKTVEEAKELALDQLGVDAEEAEFEVLDEPKAGLFGRVRGEARVRARVRPMAPRSKDSGKRRTKRESSAAAPRDAEAQTRAVATGAKDPVVAGAIADAIADPQPVRERPTRSRNGRNGAGSSRGGRGRSTSTERRPRRSDGESSRGEPVSVESLEAQGQVAVTFLNGLLDAFGFQATVGVRSVNDSAVEVAVDGEDLGLLVGPRGATLQAIQDLTRTAVLRETGMREGWVIVDVAEYRVKRRAALEKFAMQVAEQVTTGGVAVRLDPMPPADRKVVHDVLTPIEGIETSVGGRGAASSGRRPASRGWLTKRSFGS